MKKLALFAVVCFLLFSCIKHENETTFNKNFNYITTKEVTAVNSTLPCDVYNQDGDLIAANVTEITPLTIGVSDVISTRVAEQTKAPKDKYVYFPSNGKYATLWFEDLFPAKGDYDMNDIAIGFNYEFVVDKTYDVITSMIVSIDPRAIGSSYKKIGLALAIESPGVTIIKSVINSSPETISTLFTVDNKGAEINTNQTKQVVIPISGNLRAHFEQYNDSDINVYNGKPHNTSLPFTITINFEKGIAYSDMTIFGTNKSKYNIDMFAVFNERSREVHLKGMAPTALFNKALFVKTNKTDFSTTDNYVWGLMMPKAISHSVETHNIDSVFPKFKQWVESEGKESDNWYNQSNKDLTYEMNYNPIQN